MKLCRVPYKNFWSKRDFNEKWPSENLAGQMEFSLLCANFWPIWMRFGASGDAVDNSLVP
jgi:hypothetical protein